jgi:hypothetical protein
MSCLTTDDYVGAQSSGRLGETLALDRGSSGALQDYIVSDFSDSGTLTVIFEQNLGFGSSQTETGTGRVLACWHA